MTVDAAVGLVMRDTKDMGSSILWVGFDSSRYDEWAHSLARGILYLDNLPTRAAKVGYLIGRITNYVDAEIALTPPPNLAHTPHVVDFGAGTVTLLDKDDLTAKVTFSIERFLSRYNLSL